MTSIQNSAQNVNSSLIGHNGPPSDEDDALSRDGWIAVARAMRSHWLVGFGNKVDAFDPDLDFVYSRSEAWLDLIMECRYFAGTVNNNGRKMRLEPGQLVGATSWLASRWNWSPKQVRTFLDKLEEEGMIVRNLSGTHPCRDESHAATLNGPQKGRSKGRFANVLTVSKYAVYQLAHRERGQVDGPSEGKLSAGRGQVEGRLRAGSGQVESESPNNFNSLQPSNKGTREQGNNAPSSTQQAPDVLAGLNGAAYPMLESIKAWVGMPEANAREWLSNAIRLLGEEPVKQAYQQLDTKIKTKGIVSQPLQLWSRIARDFKNGKPPPADDFKAALKAGRDKIRAEMGWKDNG